MLPAAEQDSGKLTKRKMLSLLAKISDPLGLVGPAVIQGKEVFQEACKILKEWDTEVPDEVKNRWEGWKRGICKENQIHVHRCIVPVNPLCAADVSTHLSQVMEEFWQNN